MKKRYFSEILANSDCPKFSKICSLRVWLEKILERHFKSIFRFFTSVEVPKYLTTSICKISATILFSFISMHISARLAGQSSLCAPHRTGQERMNHLHCAYFSFASFTSVFVKFSLWVTEVMLFAVGISLLWVAVGYLCQMKYCCSQNLGTLMLNRGSSS